MAQKFDLPDLIAIALEKNPQIDIATQQYAQSKGQVTQAQSGYLPRLSIGGTGGQIHIYDLHPEEEDTVLNTNINASQLIYDFGKTIGTIQSSKFIQQAAGSNLEQKLQDVIFQVKEAYYSVLEKNTLVSVAQQAVTNYQQHLYRAKKYFEAGVRTQIDITNAELELANTRLNLLRSNSNVKTARVKLEQLIGTKPNGGNYTLVVTGGPLESLSKNLPPIGPTLDQLLETARVQRPGLHQLEQLVFAAEASIKRAEGENWPLISANGSYDQYETDLPTFNDQWQITAALTWEIFSGFETKGKIMEAKGKMLEVTASKHELELAIIQDVTDSYLRAEENYDGVDIADLAVQLAKQNLGLAEERYKAGLGDMIEFNDAQLNYTLSQSNLVSIYYGYLTALARRDRAAGINLEISEDKLQELLNQ